MGKILVLAEKPSVAGEIARVLGCKRAGAGCMEGEKYIVCWALGHLVTLADPEAYGDKYKTWRLEDLPMLPQSMKTVVIGKTSKQFRLVSALMARKDVDELVIATDAGREGELVARWIMQKAHWRGKTSRLWISSQTDRAIKEGFRALRPASEYDALYRSARARAQADWLVGLNVTRALTCKHNAQLSAGRVQTPTLAMIVEREEEIMRFRAREYFTLHARLGTFEATYTHGGGQTRFFERSKLESLVSSAQGKPGVVKSLRRSVKRVAPPALYDLTELQRDANRKYAFSAKQTLSLMQSLYETHKLLTYPRTDSRYITSDVSSTVVQRLQAVSVGPYKEAARALIKNHNIKHIVNDAGVSDHHAIIPTEEYVDLNRLSTQERRIYDLVVRRFMAALSCPCEYDELSLTIEIDGLDFCARGRVLKELGWRGVCSPDPDGDEDEDIQSLPLLKTGDRIAPDGLFIKAGKTKPPARYTEATLLSAMENPGSQVEGKELIGALKNAGGLGTPATRADIIEKLLSSFYIERRGKELAATSKGKQLISLVPQQLKSAALTAQWELELDLISKGRSNDEKFLERMRDYAASLVSEVIKSESAFRHDNVTREICPDCGKFLLSVNGKKGRMLVCQDRICGYRRSLSVLTNARCPECHKRLELRNNSGGKAFFCGCGFREKLSDFEKRRGGEGAGRRDVSDYLKNQEKNGAAKKQCARRRSCKVDGGK